MTTTVFLAVLLAALLHATWNALLKGDSDKTLAMVCVVLGHVPFALAAMVFFPVPRLESWPFLIGNVVLHVGYQLFLMNSYRLGDLSKVYPLARGSAPLLVTLISVLFLGVVLKQMEIVAICIIGAGIISLAFLRDKASSGDGKASLLALITGCFIAGYSLNDGLGARAAGTAVGFYAWATIGNALVMIAYARIAQPGLLRRIPTDGMKQFIIGGGASFVAYSLVMWAFTQAPIALVTALRETSIIFATLIGIFIMKERVGPGRLIAIGTVLAGAIMLRMAAD